MRRGGAGRFYNHLSNTERRIVHWGNLDEDEKQLQMQMKIYEWYQYERKLIFFIGCLVHSIRRN